MNTINKEDMTKEWSAMERALVAIRIAAALRMGNISNPQAVRRLGESLGMLFTQSAAFLNNNWMQIETDIKAVEDSASRNRS